MKRGRHCETSTADERARERIETQLANVPAAARATAEARRVAVGRWTAAQTATRWKGRKEALAAVLESMRRDYPQLRISEHALRDWQTRYRRFGTAGLIDSRWLPGIAKIPGFVRVPGSLAAGAADQLELLVGLGLAYTTPAAVGSREHDWHVWEVLLRGGTLIGSKRLAGTLAAWLTASFAREVAAQLEALAGRMDETGVAKTVATPRERPE